MRTASLADCKELYELSGWNGQEWWHVYQAHQDGSGSYYIAGSHEAPFSTSVYPAYDADYLADMLPAHTLGKRGNGSFYATWEDHTSTGKRGITLESRTNPANALCRLACELFRAGVLLSDD